MTLNELIHFYFFNCANTNNSCPSMIGEMNAIKASYDNGTAIDEVLRKCVCNRHGHQYCIPDDAVTKAVDVLKDSKYIRKDHKSAPFIEKDRINEGNIGFSDFEDLHDFIRYTIGGINGVGPLTVYDTAKRIGHILKHPIYPQEYVYLSAGAMDGAQALLGCTKLNFREPIEMFQPYFGTLGSIFVEDILCIFKDVFATYAQNGSRGKCPCIQACPHLYFNVIIASDDSVKKAYLKKRKVINVKTI